MNERARHVKGAGNGMLWAPAAIGCGIAAWFAAPVEPPGWALLAGSALSLLLLLVAWRLGRGVVMAAALALVMAGAGAAGLRARLVAAPVLPVAIEATVEGRVLHVDQARSGWPRVTLADPAIEGSALSLRRVRITLSRTPPGAVLPRDRIRVAARLVPPGGPVAPGAYDFARAAWFARLGAVGYARAPPEILSRGSGGIDRLRARLSRAIRDRVAGAAGGVAAALTVGDRAAIPPAINTALRDAGLAHLLAISGLHVGLVAGLVFTGLRAALALIPGMAERYAIKKLAAILALAAAAGYLLLSGAAISTQRAFVMTAIALGAVLIDRPALTFRGLAAAAVVLLLWRPESLLQPGFQMSFAAATALVAVYEGAPVMRAESGLVRRLAVFVLAGALTSLVAGLASGPFAAWHFGRVAVYGLVANVLAVPVAASWIMPWLLVAGLLMPLGLSGHALDMAAIGIRAVLSIAEAVASWPGAVRLVHVAAFGVVPGLIALGGLMFCLLGGAWRLAGFLPLVVGMALWIGDARPDVMVDASGRLVALRDSQGQLDLSRARGQGFAAEIWLSRDGDGASQTVAAERTALFCRPGRCEGLSPKGWRISWRSGVPAPSLIKRLCGPRRILVLPDMIAPESAGACLMIDRRILEATGGVSLYLNSGTYRLAPAATGQRFWRQ